MQVLAKEGNQLTLLLPRLETGRYLFVFVFLICFTLLWVSGISLLLWLVLEAHYLSMAVIIITPLILAFIGSIAVFNRAFRQETFHVDQQKMVLEEHIPLAMGRPKRRHYNLADVKEVAFDKSANIRDPLGLDRCNLILETHDKYDIFFNHEKTEGKEWLADYLNQILKDKPATNSLGRTEYEGSDRATPKAEEVIPHDDDAIPTYSPADNPTKSFDIPEPPSYAYTQIKKNHKGQLTLSLPKMGFGVKPMVLTLALMLFTTFLWELMSFLDFNFVLPSVIGSIVLLFIAIPLLILLLISLTNFFRAEELTIQNQQLIVTHQHPLPFLASETKIYSLQDIKQVGYTANRSKNAYSKQITNPWAFDNTAYWILYHQYDVYLVVNNHYAPFFKHETPIGKRWLAEHLNRIIQDAPK